MWSKIKCNYFQWMHILSRAGFWTDKGKWMAGLGGKEDCQKKREKLSQICLDWCQYMNPNIPNQIVLPKHKQELNNSFCSLLIPDFIVV